MTFRVLDLFSGIGGFSLGLERTGGFKTIAFCEIDPFCRKILAKHWPDIRQYDDIVTLTVDRLNKDGIFPDVLCGGFPCQDISLAGKGSGINGERSGLWREYARLIGEIRPRYVIVENVAALLIRGMGRVLGDLAEIGYDAEWHCIPASAIGAPHQRDRVWIIAYTQSIQCDERFDGDCSNTIRESWLRIASRTGCSNMVDSTIDRCRSWRKRRFNSSNTREFESAFCDADGKRLEIRQGLSYNTLQKFSTTVGTNWWDVEPELGRVAYGIPNRVDRLRSLGNAVVPQIPELIGRTILEWESIH